MKAVVLVGGFGTRLRPLTSTRPKQMLPIMGRPMIEHVLEHLADHDITEAVLSMGYKPDAFADTYPDGLCAGVKVHYAIEPEPLDTAGAIRFAALDAGIAERFVVVNGDILTDLDIDSLVSFHDRTGAEATIALHQVEDPSAFGVVPTDGNGRVEAFVEKPPRDEAPTDLINAGTYVLEPSVLDRIAGGRRVSIEREVFPAMAAEKSLYAMSGETYWIDTGTPPKYLQAHLDILDGTRGPAPDGTAPGAQVHGDARVERSSISDRAEVAAGARVTASVILPGARVGPDAVVDHAIVGFDAVVGAGSHIDELAVLGDRSIVHDGQRLSGGSLEVDGSLPAGGETAKEN